MTSFLFIFLALSLALRVRGNSQLQFRKLQQDDDTIDQFIIFNLGNDSWCIELRDGSLRRNNKLILSKCRFGARPKKQLWKLTSDGMLRSMVNEKKCVGVGDVYSGAWLRVNDCGKGDTEQIWTTNGLALSPKGYENALCVTNRGPNPNQGDPILLKKCTKQLDQELGFSYDS